MIFKTKDADYFPVRDVTLSCCSEYVSLKQDDASEDVTYYVVIPLHRIPAFIKALLKVYLKSLKGTK